MAILIIATLTPVVVGMAGTAREDISVSGAEEEAERLADGISRAYYGGNGAIVTVRLNLGPGESLALGGSGGDEYAIRIIMNGEEAGRVYLERPAVPVLNEASVSGDAFVTLTCETVDGVYGVRVGR